MLHPKKKGWGKEGIHMQRGINVGNQIAVGMMVVALILGFFRLNCDIFYYSKCVRKLRVTQLNTSTFGITWSYSTHA